jgi:hypothetical protein
MAMARDWLTSASVSRLLLPVQGLFLVALAIVTAAEGSPVKILIARDA